MRFLIIIIFLISNSYAEESIDIKNLIINKELKNHSALTFLDAKNNQLNIGDYKGNNLKIFPINVGQDNIKKSLKFFEDLNIKNLDIYFDTPVTLAKKFQLRGIPTSILINKDGLEFARIVGSIDFQDKKFIDWLSNFN